MKLLENAYYRVIIFFLLFLDSVMLSLIIGPLLCLVAILLLLPCLYEIYREVRKADKDRAEMMRFWWIAPSVVLSVNVFDKLAVSCCWWNGGALIYIILLALMGLVAFVFSVYMIVIFSRAGKIKQVFGISLLLVVSFVVSACL